MATWGIRWTRPDGTTGMSLTWRNEILEFNCEDDAERLAALCRLHCSKVCTYVAVPFQTSKET